MSILINSQNYDPEQLLEKEISIRDNGNNNRVIFDDFPKIDGKGRIEITFNGDNNEVRFERNVIVKNILKVKFTPQQGYMPTKCFFKVGQKTWFNGLTNVNLSESGIGVEIGQECLIANKVSFRVCDGHTIYDITTKSKINHGKSIKVGNHVWIAEDVKFLKGSFVDNDSVVATRALVTRKFNRTNILVGGVPASILKENINWDIHCNFENCLE